MTKPALPASKQAVVIGGGFGGLAAALRLRALGHRVTLLERNPSLGGRAQRYARDGFIHDAGPTVVTAPQLFDELFALFDQRLADRVELIPLDHWYRFRFHDGGTFGYGQDLQRLQADLEAFAPGASEGYRQLLEQARRMFELGFLGLADQPFHRLSSMLKLAPALLREQAYRSVYGLVGHYVKDQRLRRAFSTAPLLVGGHPGRTTAIYLLIHYLERHWGVHYPKGGVYALVEALEALARDAGVEIRCNTTVERIRSAKSGRLQGLRLADGGEIPAELAVSDADPAWLYARLERPRRWTPKRLHRLHYSMGLCVLYFGATRSYPAVQQHSIYLGPRFTGLLDEIFDGPALPADFNLYLHRPTATDPGMAPPGCDSFYALVPVPNLRAGTRWDQAGPALEEQILDRLEQTFLPGLRQCLHHRFMLTPEDFAERYLSRHGAGFSIAPVLTQSAWFRFHNRSEEVDGLYLTGAGTHPGAGIPGVLSSAKVIERLLRES